MKKVIPFSKQLTFKTMIREITDIEIKHTLCLKDDYELEGDILVDGKYKMTDASILEEEFHYKLPFVVAIDSKYDTSNLEVSISDFNFEIINEEKLQVNVEIQLDNLEEKEMVRHDIEIPISEEEKIEAVNEKIEPLEELEKEIKKSNNQDKNKVEVEEKNFTHKQEENTNIGSIFSSLTSNDESFSTYHVYIVRENDTLEEIMEKYKITREALADYNDLDDIKIGTKLIVPCSNDE